MSQPKALAMIAEALAACQKGKLSNKSIFTLGITALALILALRRTLTGSKNRLISDARRVARQVKEPEYDFDEYDFIIVGGGVQISPGMWFMT